MFAHERQKLIQSMINKNGSVNTTELVKKFNVSVETIRRDLLSMEKENLLYRVHGGAVKIGEMKPFSELSERMRENNPLKIELCRTAIKHIEEGDVIGIDSGSTAFLFADALKERFSSLTVVTHSLDVFEKLCKHKDFEVILCGGHFRKKENSFYGMLTNSIWKQLHVQKMFLFPAAISFQYGLCEHNSDTVLMQQQMIKSADKVFILADSSKFECKELIKVDEMRTGYTYITDSNLPAALKAMYLENGLNVVTE